MDAAFTLLEKLLKDHGTNLSEVVKVMMYVDSMDSYLAMNQQYVRYFGLNPLCECVLVWGVPVSPPRCRILQTGAECGGGGCSMSRDGFTGGYYWAL